MAKFQKGNPGKRPGAKRKRTKEAEKRVEFVLAILDETIETDIKKLRPQERARLWQDLQEYIRPKLARTEQTGETKQDITIKVVRE
jgi:hypothetical protein